MSVPCAGKLQKRAKNGADSRKNSCPPAGFFEKSYKYFTPEGDARPLENLIRKQGNITELVFTVHPNQPPQIKDLLINGQNWKDAPQN